jgi:FkbM family methyltransferase
MNLRNKARAVAHRWRRPLFELIGSDRYSHLALNELDRKLKKYIDFRDGYFIEAGANDGLTQSNTYWFEQFRGWRGLLIEAVPEKAQACRRNRPRATIVQSALVASDTIRSVQINTADLMAFVAGHSQDDAEERARLTRAMSVQNLREVKRIDVPAKTLSSILDDLGSPGVDLLSLDVEGFELEVLKGLDLRRHRPAYILLETDKIDAALDVLGGNYCVVDLLSHHDFLLKVVLR